MMATTSIYGTLLVLLMVTSAREAVDQSETLLMNKCCPIGQQLDDWIKVCITIPGSNESAVARETVGELRQRLGEWTQFPSWMLNNTKIYNPESEEVLIDNDEFLGNISEKAFFRYGNRPCGNADTQILTSTGKTKFKIFSNGTLQYMVFRTNGSEVTPQRHKIYLPPEEWCYDRFDSGPSSERYALLTCPCGRVTCVNRCCFPGAFYKTESHQRDVRARCTRSPEAKERIPTFYQDFCVVAGPDPEVQNDTDMAMSNTGADGCENVTRETIYYTFLYGHQPTCMDNYRGVLLNPEPSWEQPLLRLWLQRNGSAVLEDFGNDHAFQRHHLCVDRALLGDDQRSEQADTAFFCHVIKDTEPLQVSDIYYSLLFLLGSVFLLLTLLAHALVASLRRTAYAKALCCHCATLLVASVTLAAGHLRTRMWQPWCSITAYIIQLSFLACFFWLNVMCFDLSRTFSKMRRKIPGQSKRSRRFLYYSLYGWGCPALITAIALFMDFAPDHILDVDNPMRPNVGVSSCWFQTKWKTLTYFYGPIAILLLANMAMFALTVFRIYIARRGTSILRKGSDNACAAGGGGTGGPGAHSKKPDDKNIDRQQFAVFTKLFLLMGVTWVTEVASWLVNDASNFFFYLTDAINLLRGVVIFFLFCWKPPVVDPLRSRAMAAARRWGLIRVEGTAVTDKGKSGSCTSTSTSVSTLDSGMSMSEIPSTEDASPQKNSVEDAL